MFRYRNVNPNKRDIEDCAIRCISTVEGVSWSNAYKKLSNFARKKGLMISSVEAVEQYLDSFYDREYVEEETVGEFIQNHPQRNLCNNNETVILRRWLMAKILTLLTVPKELFGTLGK